MSKVSTPHFKPEALRPFLTQARKDSSDVSIDWERLEGLIRGGELSIDDRFELTRAFQELTGGSRFAALRTLVHSGLYVVSEGGRLVTPDHFPMEESWHEVWERFASTALPMDRLYELADEDNGRTRFFYPEMVEIIEQALANTGRSSISLAMHAAGSLLLRFFAEDELSGAFEITRGSPSDVHPEAVVKRLSERGVRDASYLLFKILGGRGVDPVLRSYAIQIALFMAKHKSHALADDSRRFFIDRVIRPALKDEEMFNVYTAYLALRLFEPAMAANLNYGDVGHYRPMGHFDDKYDQYIRATFGSLRMTIFGSVLEGLVDFGEGVFDRAPFGLTRPMHILPDYRPDQQRMPLVKNKFERLRELASHSGFTREKMWKDFFTYTEDASGQAGRDIEMLDIGDGQLYVLDGHGRVASAIMAAAYGVIPSEWLIEVPASFHVTRDLPTPLMYDIVTLGVDLTWPDLFPGDERVQRFLAEKDKGPGGGGSGGMSGPGGGLGTSSNEMNGGGMMGSFSPAVIPAAGLGAFMPMGASII